MVTSEWLNKETKGRKLIHPENRRLKNEIPSCQVLLVRQRAPGYLFERIPKLTPERSQTRVEISSRPRTGALPDGASVEGRRLVQRRPKPNVLSYCSPILIYQGREPFLGCRR